MTDDTAAELARCAEHARRVCELLPIDEDAERRVSQLMQQRSVGYTPRKLARRTR